MQETLETWVQSLGWEDPLENEIATYSSTLAWEILWTEEPGRLQPLRSPKSQARLSMRKMYAHVYTHTHTYIHIKIY